MTIERPEEYAVIARDRRATTTTTTMEAILTRDQRTTSHRVLDRRFSAQCAKVSSSSSSAKTTTTTTTATPAATTATTGRTKSMVRDVDHRDFDIFQTRNRSRTVHGRNVRCDPCFGRCSSNRGIRRFTTTTWLRLGSLLVTLLVVSVHGAPAMTLEDRRLKAPPKWVNPCGLVMDSDSGDVQEIQNSNLLHQILVQAKTAKMHAELFRDDYIRQTFNTDFEDLHSQWKTMHYNWLPSTEQIPKELGEQLDQEYLSKLKLDTALLDVYEYMQKYAVGLEQVVWDQEDYDPRFINKFKDVEFKLRTVLCELQVALDERGVPQREDVSRSVMSNEYRRASSMSDATSRILRDWLIFRDYMNGLEYLVQVFEYFKQGLES